jgi:hypothetical protein
MKKLLFLIPVLCLLSCQHALCPAAKDAANKAAVWMQVNCGCDEAAIEAALDAKCESLGICAKTENYAGPISNIACPLVINDILVPLVANASFFQAYSCTKAAECLQIVAQPIISACEMIPFNPKAK